MRKTIDLLWTMNTKKKEKEIYYMYSS
jgi:hypothetical protein